MIVVGARPNFMKAAPLIRAIQNRHRTGGSALDGSNDEARAILVHTGQHYDEAMSGSFFTDLALPKPDVYLGVGSGSHAVQTGEIMRLFEQVLLSERPEAIVVVGDVNSTVACALVASKISYDGGGGRPLIAHVEAGLRSFDRAMPEEVNRVVTDHLSDLLFVTEESGVENLIHEGIAEGRIHFTGNTMIDSLLASQGKADRSGILQSLGVRKNGNGANGNGSAAQKYALLTLHRPSNVDNRETFSNILNSLDQLAEAGPIFFSAHPRTRKRIEEFGLEAHFNFEGTGARKGIRILEPLGYLDFLCLTKHATVVVTDSGGIQEETTCLGVPCVTVRENTERPVTVMKGTNVIAGTNPVKIREAIRTQLDMPKIGRAPEKWDGHAAERIVETLLAELTSRIRNAGVDNPVSLGGYGC
ncbi:MAG: non-hydrolyzing UDP-N-acetylglucosamine 2-epimerase [Candidatus Acidiferrales bacterium]